MKRTLFFFLLVVAVGLAGCKSKEKISNPEDIGHQVMEILEDMSDISRPEFRAHFISSNGLHALAKDKKLVKDEEQRRILLGTTKKELKERYNFMHRRLKSAGKRRGINWKRIEFDSFTYKLEEFGGAKFCYGVVKFKYKNRHFSIDTTSVYNGSGYVLVGIQDLRSVASDAAI